VFLIHTDYIYADPDANPPLNADPDKEAHRIRIPCGFGTGTGAGFGSKTLGTGTGMEGIGMDRTERVPEILR
jgi:hypothetical protein